MERFGYLDYENETVGELKLTSSVFRIYPVPESRENLGSASADPDMYSSLLSEVKSFPSIPFSRVPSSSFCYGRKEWRALFAVLA